MRRLAVLLVVLSACVLLPNFASASPARMNLKQFLAALGNTPIQIPPEWDGTWDTVDSSYDCSGALQGTDTGVDTLCSGTPVLGDGTFDCTGSADANTVDVTCSYSQEIFPDCAVTFSYHLSATRSADSFFAVFTNSQTYDGTGENCDLIPDSCSQDNSHGTWTGPAPTEYCATPARPTTWGGLKLLYR